MRIRNIVRDIVAKKKALPKAIGSDADVNVVGKKPEKKSPFILDLSRENVIRADIRTSDVRASNEYQAEGKQGDTFIVRKHTSTKTSIIIQLAVMAIFGMVILFGIYAARGYAAGGRLFSQITQSAKSGYGQIIQAGTSAKDNNLATARNMFEQAYSTFQQAQSQIWFIKSDPILSKYTSVLESGSLLAESGKDMTEMLERLRKVPELFAQMMSHVDESPSSESPILAELKKTNEVVAKVHANIKRTQDNMNDLISVSPKQYIPSLQKGATLLGQSEKMLNDIMLMLPGIIEIFGNGGPHRTLVLLQNNDEVRPTGGFIGSFLNLEMQNGYVISLKLEDVYDMDGQFKEVIEPPEEMRALTNRWFFRDSNYSPDFGISGEKAIWFYAKERGEKADTVIAVNQDLLGKILEITGPIELPQLRAPMTAENYREVLTYMVETKRSGADDPKKILKDMLPAIQKRLFQASNMSGLNDAILEGVIQKNILGFSKNTLTQNFFEILGADGVAKMNVNNAKEAAAIPSEDYLNITTTSTGGNKSDAYMTQEISHDTVIEKGGEVYDQLTLRRTHAWSGATEKKWRSLLKPFNFVDFPEHFLNVFGKGTNIVVVRAYLPNGSEILPDQFLAATQTASAQATSTPPPTMPLAIHHDPDMNRDYVTFTMSTNPGQTSVTKIRYKLPFKLSNILANTYALNVQKQPGARPSQLTKRIFFGDFMPLVETYPSDFIKESGGASTEVSPGGALMITKRLTRDQRFALLFARESLMKRK